MNILNNSAYKPYRIMKNQLKHQSTNLGVFPVCLLWCNSGSWLTLHFGLYSPLLFPIILWCELHSELQIGKIYKLYLS